MVANRSSYRSLLVNGPRTRGCVIWALLWTSATSNFGPFAVDSPNPAAVWKQSSVTHRQNRIISLTYLGGDCYRQQGTLIFAQHLPRGRVPTEPRRLLAASRDQARAQFLVEQNLLDAAGDIEDVLRIDLDRRIAHHFRQRAHVGRD